MEKIQSFTVDHLRLKQGLYVSRLDTVGQEVLTTFDLRMKLPNTEMLDNGAIHTLEHLLATYMRNHKTFGQKVVYFGPMGCLTGMYLILHGQYQSADVLDLIADAFAFVTDFEGAIPGVSAIECGNYLLHDLQAAKREAAAYLELLKQASEENLNYPQ